MTRSLPHRLRRWLLAGLASLAPVAGAASYPLPPPGDAVIGEVVALPGERRDTLSDIARRYNVGWDAIRQANPGVDAWMVDRDVAIILPTQYVLPDAPREGIVLNLAEMRVYYYPPAKAGQPREVVTYPASIGRMDWRTPLGATKIVRKAENPVWSPPASIKREHAEKGDFLPDTVPAGDDNPLGRHALYLGHSGYLIHGTNRPYGIGMRVTHGCVRLYPEDVEELFRRVPVGTRVLMLDAPFKAGWKGNVLYVEAHPAFNEEAEPEAHKDISPVRQVVLDAVRGQPHSPIDWTEIELIARQATGVPVATSITRSQAVVSQPAEAQAATPAAAASRPDTRAEAPLRPKTAASAPPRASQGRSGATPTPVARTATRASAAAPAPRPAKPRS
jgi:L,D-transpeptidase ErfK/SrfK